MAYVDGVKIEDVSFDVAVEEKEFVEALKVFDQMNDAIDSKYIKTVQARHARKTFVPDMRRRSHSAKLMPMISVTQAKKYTTPYSVRVGVVKNNKDKFPNFSAQALASVIEYGTGERYRQLKSIGLVTGRVSTGRMPAAPFLRPGWDANVKAFMDDVAESLENKVMKEARK